MAIPAGGHGEASGPVFSTAELNEMLTAARDRDLADEPARRIAACQTKVDKCRAFLAAAEQALADEIAAQGGTN
jgi:hypothetical protein